MEDQQPMVDQQPVTTGETPQEGSKKKVLTHHINKMTQIENIRILSMNCNSITGKLDAIKCHVVANNPDIISITETKLDDRIDDNEIFGNEYTIWRNDRDNRGGGVLVANNNKGPVKVLACTYGPGESVTLNIQMHSKLCFKLVTMY